MEIIRHYPGLKVTNLESLPACKGAKYLEVVRGPHDGAPYVAAAWRRKKPESIPSTRVLISFED